MSEETPNALRPRIYGASRLVRATMWRNQRKNNPGLIFTARWIDQIASFDDEGVAESVKRAGWIMDEEDIQSADYVCVLALDNEVLRGALVEAGMGITLGKVIVLAGASPSFGTWKYHPAVRFHSGTLSGALRWIKEHSEGKHPRG